MTPIMKAKGRGGEVVSFYSQQEYDQWLAETKDAHKFKIKYVRTKPPPASTHKTLTTFSHHHTGTTRVWALTLPRRARSTSTTSTTT